MARISTHKDKNFKAIRREARIAAKAASSQPLHHTLYTKTNEFMKKSYIAPQTEAIELLGENAIMVGSSLIIGSGEGEGGGMG